MIQKNQKTAMANLTAPEIEAKMSELKNYNDVRGFLKELVAPFHFFSFFRIKHFFSDKQIYQNHETS